MSPSTSISSAKGSIIIVDDKPANLRLLANMLTEQGYLVRPIRDPRQVALFIEEFPPDLILLDIKMPHLSGYEVCEQLKANERSRQIPVIFLSALNEAMDKVRAFSVGGVDYITKPFQLEEVLARVETHLSLQRLQQQLTAKNEELETSVHDLKAMQVELIEAKEKAEAANLAKSEFLANMNHELRTPLNGILGFAQLLIRRKELDQQVKQDLHIIQRSGNHLLGLINDILDLSKIESRKMELYPTKVHLPGVLNTISELSRIRTQEKGLKLVVEVARDIPAWVLCR